MLRALNAIFQDLPGFIDVYYYAGDAIEFRALFVGGIPPEALARSTPLAVAFDSIPQLPTPLGSGATPDLNDLRCYGIRPGTRITTPIGICTLNFIYTNATATFAGTAGHCVDEGQIVAANYLGLGAAFTIGTAVFSTGDGGVGNDFALIELSSGVMSYVTPEMCDFAGPTDTFTGSSITGKATLQTGQGLGSVSAPARPKPGVGTGWGATSFTWVGASVPGDSGSGIRLQSGEALGTVTHLSLLVPVLNFGTRWDYGLDLAEDAGLSGLTMETVTWTHP